MESYVKITNQIIDAREKKKVKFYPN